MKMKTENKSQLKIGKEYSLRWLSNPCMRKAIFIGEVSEKKCFRYNDSGTFIYKDEEREYVIIENEEIERDGNNILFREAEYKSEEEIRRDL